MNNFYDIATCCFLLPYFAYCNDEDVYTVKSFLLYARRYVKIKQLYEFLRVVIVARIVLFLVSEVQWTRKIEIKDIPQIYSETFIGKE